MTVRLWLVICFAFNSARRHEIPDKGWDGRLLPLCSSARMIVGLKNERFYDFGCPYE